MPFLWNVLGNVLANVVFWLVLGLLVWVYIRSGAIGAVS